MVSSCIIVHSGFIHLPKLNCAHLSGVSQGRQGAGREAWSRRAEKQHYQNRTQHFPTGDHCTTPKNAVRHGIWLKRWVWVCCRFEGEPFWPLQYVRNVVGTQLPKWNSCSLIWKGTLHCVCTCLTTLGCVVK